MGQRNEKETHKFQHILPNPENTIINRQMLHVNQYYPITLHFKTREYIYKMQAIYVHLTVCSVIYPSESPTI